MDPELVATLAKIRANREDRIAAKALDRILRPRLLAFFAHGPWPSHEAEDLVQKSLALVFSRMESLEQPDRFFGWLFAIARNVRSTAAGEWSARRSVEIPGAMASDPPSGSVRDGEAEAIASERRGAVEDAILELPPRQRQCLLLRVREEMSYEEIAELLRLSPLTVRNHIAQAKESLRRALAGAEEAGR
jgi:RNA polymerase sigma factor (sigma-70 family)